MKKMDALWAYQEAEVAKAAVESEIRSTPARLKLNKLHKQLKSQQGVIAKLSGNLDAYDQQLNKLTEQVEKLEDGWRWRAASSSPSVRTTKAPPRK